jgi:hypothetical protein
MQVLSVLGIPSRRAEMLTRAELLGERAEGLQTFPQLLQTFPSRKAEMLTRAELLQTFRRALRDG